MKTRSQPSTLRRLAAFSLIEIIGVMTVLVILGTILVSMTPRQLDAAAISIERTNLLSFSSALQNTILRNRYIPGSGDITNVISSELGLSVQDIMINARNNTRAIIFDPGWQFCTNRAFPDTNHLARPGNPWQQGSDGAFTFAGAGGFYGGGSNAAPIRPRILILSSMGANLPAGLASMTDSDFGVAWNTADGAVPAIPAFNGWGIYGDDLVVQRIDLSSLFVHVILYNYNYPSVNQGGYVVDPDRAGAVTNVVPNGLFGANNYGVDTFFLKGTVVGLLKSSNTGGTLDSYQILNRDASYCYAQDVWRSSANLGQGVDPRAALFGNGLWSTASTFMGSPYYNQALNGITPATVVNDIAQFMTNYVNWANLGNWPTTGVVYAQAKASQTVMMNDMQNLLGAIWKNGTFQVTMTAGACTNPPAQ